MPGLTAVGCQNLCLRPDLPWACQYDGQSAVVCSISAPSNQAFAVDGGTGKTLWRLPDTAGNRDAPTVTAVYDGQLYGFTGSGLVVLNARTSSDVGGSPGNAPVLVDSDVGIAYDSNNDLRAYQASS